MLSKNEISLRQENDQLLAKLRGCRIEFERIVETSIEELDENDIDLLKSLAHSMIAEWMLQDIENE